MDSNLPSSTTITDPISSLLNPNPTFFHLPNPNPTNSNNNINNHVYNPPFTSFAPDQANNIFLNPHASTGQDIGTHHVGVSTKNPKKRTRASRRTPTTVLTTDTTNFRQMVQEFTGIPMAPFKFSTPSVMQSVLDAQNPLFGFQSLLQGKLGDDAKLGGPSCSTRYDEVDKLNS